MNENENSIFQNLWDAVKVVSREKFIATNVYVNKEKSSQINTLSLGSIPGCRTKTPHPTGHMVWPKKKKRKENRKEEQTELKAVIWKVTIK